VTAIAGIVRFDGETVSGDAGRLGHPLPGLDGREGERWERGSVALVSFGASPVRDERTGCAVAFDGRIDNRGELRRGLAEHEQLLETGTDTAYVLAAYLQWGDEFPSRVLGDFACAVWDPGRRRLVLARDPLGVRPLHYSVPHGQVLFASRVEQLLREPAISNQVNDAAAISYLYRFLVRPELRQFYRDIRPIRPGHLLEVSDGRISERRYWQWPDSPPERRTATGDEPERFRELFTEAVRCRLGGTEVASLALSGGLDSSSIASAAGHLRGSDSVAELRTYAWRFDDLPAIDERSYSSAVAERYGLPYTLVSPEGCGPFDEVERWIDPVGEPYFGPYSSATGRILDRARADGCGLFLTTIGADELVAGGPEYLADWFFRGHWLRVHRELKAEARAVGRPYHRRAVRHVLLPLLPARLQTLRRYPVGERVRRWLPEGARRVVREQAANPLTAGPDAWWYALRRATTAESDSHFYSYWDRLLTLHGLEGRHPYLDVRLIDFGLRSPPDVFFREGRTKWVVREALRDLLPEAVRRRTDKPQTIELSHRTLRGRKAPLVRELTRTSELAHRGYVLAEPWRQDVERYLAGDDDLHGLVWISLTLEVWLRAHAGRLPAFS
jgi:asparagine synthase (glutamine-hydrolysing)